MTGLTILGIIIICFLIYKRTRKNPAYTPPGNTTGILQQHVGFYRNLLPPQKQLFEARVKDFLAHVRITGIGVEVEDLDRILVAAGAIIPIFGFKDWKYNNISEVLLYSNTFNKEDYRTEGKDRNVLGMVGDGAMNRQMILSKPSLRSSFSSDNDGHNTVIHEFTHLLDKADGSVDGVPEYMLSKPYIIPWVKEIHDTIQEMRQGEINDINLYGATNPAEFFAVVSEYFFEKPEQLKENHPELYNMLERMFNTSPGN